MFGRFTSTLRLLFVLGLAAAGGGPLRAQDTPPEIPKPQIPPATFDITASGAVGDGKTLCTDAIQRTIDAAENAGGGVINFPAGVYVSTSIELRSHIELHLAKGAVLQMAPGLDSFPIEGKTRESFIAATNITDIRISGEGTIDGQGAAWWAAFLPHKSGGSSEFPRPQMIFIQGCERIELAGFNTLNPPNTHCSLRRCKDVYIHDLNMRAPANSPNTDALNITAVNVMISKCDISTGDDNIVFVNGGKGKNIPQCTNLWVRNCKLGSGHGISIGSFTSGGVSNVNVQDVYFKDTTWGLRFKAGRDRGGVVENFTFRNIIMDGVKIPLLIVSYYPKAPNSPADDQGSAVTDTTPIWRHISFDNLIITNSLNSILIWGLPETFVSDVSFKNSQVVSTKPACIYYAKGITFENTTLTSKEGPTLYSYQAEIDGITPTPLTGPSPVKP